MLKESEKEVIPPPLSCEELLVKAQLVKETELEEELIPPAPWLFVKMQLAKLIEFDLNNIPPWFFAKMQSFKFKVLESEDE